jgi:hypothetical protein
VVENVLSNGVALSEKDHQIIHVFQQNYETYLKEVDDNMGKDKYKVPHDYFFGDNEMIGQDGINIITTFDFSGLKQRLEKLKDRVSSTELEPKEELSESFFLGTPDATPA